MGEQEKDHQQQLPMDEMLNALNSLDERADKIGTLLEQIEARMKELRKEEEEEKEAMVGTSLSKARMSPSQAGGGRSRCRLGRVILMMGMLSIFMPGNGARAEERRAAYNGLQGLLKNVAMGIEEKQAEMREMNLSLSTKRAELIELEKTILRRQKLLT
jgi:hypothetical protein